jgi:hypothetical protein
MLRQQLSRLRRIAGNLAPRRAIERKRADAKALWSEKYCGCEYADRIYEAALPATWHRILEFGANWGGNLEYFLTRHPDLRVVGVDVNTSVLKMAETYPQYEGIVGDETTLRRLESKSFDLAFTCSVLDHIPSAAVVEDAIRDLVRLAPHVILLEPFIDGVHGDVSGKTRNDVKNGLPRGHKRFAEHSYLWNYDRMLARLGVQWSKRPMPLHSASLGPFYCLYDIRNASDGSTLARRR